ncbi:hypothetical protein DESUT3_20330 [Desulfuromonas versatilis]|uniref:Uncharacterized protein n=1 Tax=Desulfuromonas versatilis TaxID=2802975 RepID=A0ABM8HRQ2_9BACT|nr:hypothetical protein [Desulfuromonas versatilis]BCR04964.1 hypothetical protein DESUT3_20330 [Desulfuromonas versatilis]
MTRWIRGFRLALLAILFSAGGAVADETAAQVFTFWPVVDYRHSQAADYTSLNLLGPLFKFERKAEEREYSLRPFFFTATDGARSRYSEYLYPVATRKAGDDQSFWQVFHLLQYDFEDREEAAGEENEFFFFPFVFYGQHPEKGRYFALFPLGGKIYDKFGRDEIRFTLFPLYGRTLKKGTRVTNILWPVFSLIRGEQESGFKLWPLYGASEKQGVYRKRFYLWPVFFRYDLRLDTENPERLRTVFPLYVGRESSQETSRSWLWPFFAHIDNRAKGFEEWQFPWPIFRVTRGETRQGNTFLPFYADERVGERRKRWFLWPVYKIEEIHSEIIDRRRDRILYFLFSSLEETVIAEGRPRKRRTALWPLFTYEQNRGVSHFHTLSLLEPFFPDNQGFARNWAPLWRLYQVKWDGQGNEASSLLWNLYWKERQGDDLAMEVFPLFSFRRESGLGTDFKLVKGLFRYRSGARGNRVNLFYLPWAIQWGAPASAATSGVSE